MNSVRRYIGLLLVLAWSGAAAAQDYSTYCEDAGDKSGFTVFVIDVTDPLSDVDKRRLAEGAVHVFDRTPGGDRLAVVLMSDRPEYIVRPFISCMPGCDPDRIGLYRRFITRSCIPAQVAEDKARVFDNYRNVLAGMLREDFRETKQSHIIETLRSIAADYRGSKISRLYIFSDMIENSGLGRFSRLEEKDVEGQIRKVRDEGLIPNFTGTEVLVFGFGAQQGRSANIRPMPPSVRRGIQLFWTSYFNFSGARLINMSGEFSP